MTKCTLDFTPGSPKGFGGPMRFGGPIGFGPIKGGLGRIISIGLGIPILKGVRKGP